MKLGHQHKFYLATTKASFEQVNSGNNELFRMIEYAYLICNGCQDGPTVIKRKIINKEGEE